MDDGRESDEPPALSRIGRADPRRYRVLTRTSRRYQGRDRFARLRRQRPIEELVGQLIRSHGLTDEVRWRVVCLHWPEIAGERIAATTFPLSFADGVLQVSAKSSSWVQEMQFMKARLVGQINAWIDARRVWLGPAPLVTDMRFVLGSKQREPLIDPEHVRRLRRRHLQRLRPPPLAPPALSDAERAAILADTQTVDDPELRAAIEHVRLTWNR